MLIGEGERRNLVVGGNEEKWSRCELSEGELISIVIDADVLAMTGCDAQVRPADGLVRAWLVVRPCGAPVAPGSAPWWRSAPARTAPFVSPVSLAGAAHQV